MSCQNFLVTFEDGGWIVFHHRLHLGPFSTRAEAMGAAVGAAGEAGRACGCASVFAMDEDGYVYTAWTYRKVRG
jgi:hypothetical protein